MTAKDIAQVPNIKYVMSGYNEKWDYNWCVLEVADNNGSLPAYVIMRDQGAHDGRYFIIKVSTDKEFIISEAERIFKLKHTLRFHD